MNRRRNREPDVERGEVPVFRPSAQLYSLAVHHRTRHTRTVGSLGEVRMPAGWIYYVGRARRGWGSRCRRYARSIETPHWHIDYLMSCSDAALRGICPVRGRPEEECELFRTLEGVSGITPLTPGFGASDCSAGCRAHAAAGKRPPEDVFGSLSERADGVTGWVEQNVNLSRWRCFDGGRKGEG